MIRYFGVGGSRVVKGSVLRALALIENASSKEPTIRGAFVTLSGEEIRQVKLSRQTAIADSPRVNVVSFIADIDTAHLPPGGYQLTLTVDDDEESLDELIWILNSEAYEKLLDEELRQVDSSTPPMVYTSNLDQQLVRRLAGCGKTK
ncbi:MAG TPA: hypothetical protein VGR73_20430 [Bryobacteraceae bacterium]|nr:hypothetical protein [Bryobacteraceae bacterium]